MTQRSTQKMKALLATSALTAAGMLILAAPSAQANPWDLTITDGSATVTLNGANTTIDQTSSRAIGEGDLDIDLNESVSINQPSSASIFVGRDTDADPTDILGSLSSNGRIIILDENGVFFGAGANINVGSIIASTGNIDDAQFMSGANILDIDMSGSDPGAQVINNATINVADAGLAAFVAPHVVNNGIINARLGRVALGSSIHTITLDLYGDDLITVATKGTLGEALIEQSATGQINAEGGTVQITAAAAKAAIDDVINMDGIVNVSSFSLDGGKIILSGGPTGKVTTDTMINASSVNGENGSVEISGEALNIGAGTFVRAGELTVETGDITVSTNANAEINATALETALNVGTDVLLKTNKNGAGNVTIMDDVRWVGAGSLRTDAKNDVRLNARIRSDHASGDGSEGAVILKADNDFLMGSYSNIPQGKDRFIYTENGDLTINVRNDIKLGAGNGKKNRLLAGEGNITLKARNDILITSLSDGKTDNFHRIISSNGNVNIDARAAVTIAGGDSGNAHIWIDATNGNTSIKGNDVTVTEGAGTWNILEGNKKLTINGKDGTVSIDDGTALNAKNIKITSQTLNVKSDDITANNLTMISGDALTLSGDILAITNENIADTNITLESKGDFTLSNNVTWSSDSRFNLKAGNNLYVNNRIVSEHAAGGGNKGSLKLTAGNDVLMGSYSNTPQNNHRVLQTVNGNLSINAGNDIKIGAGNSKNNRVLSTKGDIKLKAGNDILVTALNDGRSGNWNRIITGGNTTLEAANKISMLGGNSGNGALWVGSTGKKTTITSNGLTVREGAGTWAKLEGESELNINGGTGTVDIDAGTALEAAAIVISGDDLIVKSDDVTADTMKLDAVQSLAFAQNFGSLISNNIADTSFTIESDGDIDVNSNVSWATGSTLSLDAGNDIFVNARLGSSHASGDGSEGAITIAADNDVLMGSFSNTPQNNHRVIETANGDLTITAGNDVKVGAGNSKNNRILSGAGDILIDAENDIIVSALNDGKSGNWNRIISASGDVTLDAANDLNLSSGQGDNGFLTVGAGNVFAPTTGGNNVAIIEGAGQTTQLIAGNAMNVTAGIGDANIDAGVALTATDISVSGDDINVFSTDVTADTMKLDAVQSLAFAQNFGSLISNNIADTSFTIESDGDIDVNSNVSWATGSTLSLDAGNDVFVNARLGSSHASGDGSEGAITIAADNDVLMGSFSNTPQNNHRVIETANGDLTITAGNDVKVGAGNSKNNRILSGAGDILIDAENDIIVSALNDGKSGNWNRILSTSGNTTLDAAQKVTLTGGDSGNGALWVGSTGGDTTIQATDFSLITGANSWAKVEAGGALAVNTLSATLDGDLDSDTITGTNTTVQVLSNNAQIQDAVDISASGAIVTIHADTYVESVTIDKSLTLNGSNQGVDAVDGVRNDETIVGPQNRSDDVFVITADNVTIDGLTIDRGERGVDSNRNDNITIMNNIITGSDNDGIRIRRGDNIRVEDNRINNRAIGREGVLIERANNVRVVNNDIDARSDAIRLDRVTDAMITGNALTTRSNEGIELDRAERILIGGNTLNGIGGTGIEIDDSSVIIIAGNELTNIDNEGIEIDDSSLIAALLNRIDTTGNEGIEADDSSHVLVALNQLSNIGEEGIDLDNITGSAFVIGNIINGAGDNGIELVNISSGNLQNDLGPLNRRIDREEQILGGLNTVIVAGNTVTNAQGDGIHMVNVQGGNTFRGKLGIRGELGPQNAQLVAFDGPQLNNLERNDQDGNGPQNQIIGRILEILGSGAVIVAENTINNAGGNGIYLDNVRAGSVFLDGPFGRDRARSDVNVAFAAQDFNEQEQGFLPNGLNSVIVNGNTINGAQNGGIILNNVRGGTVIQQNRQKLQAVPTGPNQFNVPGIIVTSQDVQVTGNDINNTQTGLTINARGSRINVADNSFTENTTGMLIQGGLIDLTGAANSFSGGDVAIRIEGITDNAVPVNAEVLRAQPLQKNAFAFFPAQIGPALGLVDNSFGTTQFGDVNTAFIELTDGAFDNQVMNAQNVTFATNAGNITPSAQNNAIQLSTYNFIEQRIIHEVDNSTLGRVDFGTAIIPPTPPVIPAVVVDSGPTGDEIEQEDIFNTVSDFEPSDDGLNITVQGLPFTTQQQLLQGIEPAAGEDGEQAAEELAGIAPAAGGDETPYGCWQDLGTGASVTINYGSEISQNLSAAADCGQ